MTLSMSSVKTVAACVRCCATPLCPLADTLESGELLVIWRRGDGIDGAAAVRTLARGVLCTPEESFGA